MTPQRATWYLSALLIGQVILFAGLAAVDSVRAGSDFAQWYAAGTLTLESRAEGLYQAEDFRKRSGELAGFPDGGYFLYPPSTAVLFAPLAVLPFKAALAVWWLIQAGCLALVLKTLFNRIPPGSGWRWPALLAALSFTPLVYGLVIGQMGVLWLTIVCCAYQLEFRSSPVWSGIVLSGLALKPPFAAAMVLWLLIRGKRSGPQLRGMFLGFLIQFALVMLCLGTVAWTEYVRVLPQLGDLAGSYRFQPGHQHGVAFALINTFGPAIRPIAPVVHLVYVASCLGLLFAIIVRCGSCETSRWDSHEPTSSVEIEWSAAVCLILAISPHLMTYDLALLILPIAWLLDHRNPRLNLAAGMLYVSAMLTICVPLFILFPFTPIPIAIFAVLLILAREARADQSPSAATERNRV